MVTNILLVCVLLLLLVLLFKQSKGKSDIQESSDIYQIHDSLGVLKGYLENLSNATVSNIQDVKSAVEKIEEYFINTRSRGHVGERLLDETLRSFGFIEGKDYIKQKDYVVDGVQIKPDVTFFLPSQVYLYIDSKFPLDNYRKYMETKDKNYLDKLAFDVRKIIKDLSDKPYINENTVDFVLMFIGSEAVYDILYTDYYNVFEEAFSNRIVICSSSNLYPILAILRRFGEYKLFNSYKADIFSIIKKISSYMDNYTETVNDIEKMARKLDSTVIQIGKIGTNIQNLLSVISSIQPGFSLAEVDLTPLKDDLTVVIDNPNYGIQVAPERKSTDNAGGDGLSGTDNQS